MTSYTMEELRKLWPLDYWNSQEFTDVERKIHLLSQSVTILPPRIHLFRALHLTSLRACRCAVFGQDAYARIYPKIQATGVAFESELPGQSGGGIPGSLRTIYDSYRHDFSFDPPTSGCLERWCRRGVLLWNVTPTIEVSDGIIHSHQYWTEWPPLTQEIVERLSAKGGIVFVFMGARARQYAQYVDTKDNYNSCIFLVHPSPRAQTNTDRPMKTSRWMSTVNELLVNVHCSLPAIDWKLD